MGLWFVGRLMEHVTDTPFIKLQIVPSGAGHPCLPCRPSHLWMQRFLSKITDDNPFRILTIPSNEYPFLIVLVSFDLGLLYSILSYPL